ncbi:MAG: insulinase family protein [Myxococcales bacterium]|nr:insulinase family protein [Myxococcales bacterium]
MAKTRSRRPDQSADPALLTLSNGLRVVLQQARFSPVVSLSAWVGVGSADESPAEAGLAHLHEHMIFKGTARRGVGQIAREVEGAGGEINAFTSYDHTCYYLTMGRDDLELGLDILADAIGGATFDADELRKEIEVVLEEIRLYRDLPQYHVSEGCWGEAFRAHPYGKPILGDPRVLRALKRGELLRFYRKHYRAPNLVLAVAGDFEWEPTRRLIAKLFGALPGGPLRAAPRPVEPAQTHNRSLVMRDPIRQAHLALAWHGVSWGDPAAAELDLLSLILGHGDSSRLEHRVKSMKRLVHEVTTQVFSSRDPGLFGIEASTNPELIREAYQAVLAETYQLSANPVSEEELERAKLNIEAAFIGKRETASGIGQALGYSVILSGGVDLERRYLERVLAADRAGLRRTAERFFTHANLTATVLVPSDFKLQPRELAQLSRQARQAVTSAAKPVAKAKKAAVAPALIGCAGCRRRLKRAVLPNGIRVIVQETDHAPLVAIRTLSLGGLRYETAANNGIANLTAQMLTRGTARLSAITFAKIVEGMAGNMHGISGNNSIGVGAEFLSRDFDRGFELVAEAMREPAFRSTELARKKQEITGYIRDKLDNPSQVVRDLFMRTLFPAHPYGLPMLGSEETLRGLDAEALRLHWQELLCPANLVIAIAGDVSFEAALARIEKSFGDLPARPFAPLRLPPPQPPAGVVRVAETLAKEQTHLLVGFLGSRIGSADEYALHVLNAALSGQGGRLFLELRDRRHLAYSVFSFVREGIERGSFGVYLGTSPQTADEALAALLEQLERVISQPPAGRELRWAKRYLIGSHQLDMQTAGSVALTMGLNELLDLGYRAHLLLADRVRKVTEKQIAAVVRKYLTLERMVVARVGEGERAD